MDEDTSSDPVKRLIEQLALIEQASLNNPRLPVNFYTPPFNGAEPAIEDDIFAVSFDPQSMPINTTSEDDSMVDFNGDGIPIPVGVPDDVTGYYTPSYASFDSNSSFLSNLSDREGTLSVVSSAGSSPLLIDSNSSTGGDYALAFDDFLQTLSSPAQQSQIITHALDDDKKYIHFNDSQQNAVVITTIDTSLDLDKHGMDGSNSLTTPPLPNADYDQTALRNQLQRVLKLDTDPDFSNSDPSSRFQDNINSTSQSSLLSNFDFDQKTGFTPTDETMHTGFTPIDPINPTAAATLSLNTDFSTSSSEFHTGLTPIVQTQYQSDFVVSSRQELPSVTTEAIQSILAEVISVTNGRSEPQPRPQHEEFQEQSERTNHGTLNPDFVFGSSFSNTSIFHGADATESAQTHQESRHPGGGALRSRPTINRSRSKSDTSLLYSRGESLKPSADLGPETAIIEFTNSIGMDMANASETNSLQPATSQLLNDSLSPPPFDHSGRGHARRSSFGSMRDKSLLSPTTPGGTVSTSNNASALRRKNPANYKCTILGCDKAFTRQYNLKSHILTHTNTRPYKCDFPGCNLAFARQHDRKRHFNLHLGIRPHVCSECQAPFARLDALSRHMMAQHHRKEQGCLM